MFIVAFLALYTVFIFRGLKSPTVRPTRLAVIWSLELWCGLVQAIVNIGGMGGAVADYGCRVAVCELWRNRAGGFVDGNGRCGECFAESVKRGK